MTVPPPPNQWGSQPPTGGQPGGAPHWGPPQPWGPPPGPPQRRGGKGKWIFGGIALLAVIAVTVVITVLVVGKDSGGGSPTPTNGNGSEFASANDKGPVGIIIEDPTCAAFNRIANAFTAAETKAGWPNRDSSVPATAWTADQRSMYVAVSSAMRNAADQTGNLVKVTPHRVVREMYEQFIAYARAFTEKIAQYQPNDNHLAAVVDGLESALVDICGAITYGSAATQAPFVPEAPSPSKYLIRVIRQIRGYLWQTAIPSVFSGSRLMGSSTQTLLIGGGLTRTFQPPSGLRTRRRLSLPSHRS